MTRRVSALTEIVGLDPETNELITNSVYSWNPPDDTFVFSGHSYVYERVALMKNWSMKDIEREVRNRVEMLDYLVWKESQSSRQHPFTHRDVGRLVSYYYKEPAAALREAREEMEKGKSRAKEAARGAPAIAPPAAAA
jgi:flagellar protein FlaI